MTQHSDPKSIEENIERKRAQLGSTLDELQDRFSVERLAEEALGAIRSNAASYARSIDHAVRANPLALTLTGVGIAWLVFGSRRNHGEIHAETDLGARFREAEDMPPGGYPVQYGQVSRGRSGGEHGWADSIDSLRSRASASLRRLEEEAQSRAGAVRDYAAERTRVLADFTSDMRRTLGEGLEGLSEKARDEILHLRRQAYAARLKLGRSARRSGREVERLINEHPLIAGLVAMALGAAFAAALPRTRMEDRTFGDESDRLMSAAAARLRDERDRLARVARGIGEDARAAALDAREALGETTSEFVDHAKDRVASEVGEAEADKPDRPTGGQTSGGQTSGGQTSGGQTSGGKTPRNTGGTV